MSFKARLGTQPDQQYALLRHLTAITELGNYAVPSPRNQQTPEGRALDQQKKHMFWGHANQADALALPLLTFWSVGHSQRRDPASRNLALPKVAPPAQPGCPRPSVFPRAVTATIGQVSLGTQ